MLTKKIQAFRMVILISIGCPVADWRPRAFLWHEQFTSHGTLTKGNDPVKKAARHAPRPSLDMLLWTDARVPFDAETPSPVWSNMRCAVVLFVALLLSGTAVAQELPSGPAAATLRWGGSAQVASGGLMGANVGLLGGPTLQWGRHAWQLDLFVAGGSFLRTGAGLRYRLRLIEGLHLWTGLAMVFDVMPIHADLLAWSRWTTLGLGVEVDLLDWLYIATDFTILWRVSPLGLTRVEREDGQSFDREHGSDTILEDLRRSLLYPGVAVGVRL